MAPNEAWERVLAAVAAEAKRADALLHGPAADVTPAPVSPAGLPTEWMLPTAANSPVLPPLSEMPPVPPEMRERIEELRDHIEELQAELAAAMSELRRAGANGDGYVVRRPVVVAMPAEQPVYVDRRV